MSFLATVLQTAGQVEMVDLKDKTSEIVQKITSLKFDVKNAMDESYIKFNIFPQETVGLQDKATRLSDDMSQLLTRVESQTKRDLQNSIGELKSLSTSLQETNITLNTLQQLLIIDSEMNTAKNEQAEGHYLEAAKRIKNIANLLDQKSDIELEVFAALVSEKSLLQEHFLYDMSETWKNCITWEEAEPEKDLKKISLKVCTGDRTKFEQMVEALNYFEHLDFNVKKFGNKLLKYIFEPIITEESTVEILEIHDPAVLEVESKVTSHKPEYSVVFANTKKVFLFLHSHLNVKVDGKVTFLRKLGESICNEFCDCLIKNCLSDTIPSHSSELESYAAVSKATEEFQLYLVKLGFLGTDNQSILEYARNVDELFANKTCQIYLGRAREIMKKDLHDTVQVGPIEPIIDIKKKTYVEEKEEFEFKPEVKLSDNIYQFPKCVISKSVRELEDLVYEVLEEAVHSTDFCAVRLFVTARNIFELYCAVVPLHHKQFLETIPQQVALFHNNCLYLAHRLLTLGHEYSNRFPAVLRSSSTTFIDQVQVLRGLGTKIFLQFMRFQRNQILDIIRNSGLATLGEDPTFTPSIEKAIRQCMRQLELLKNVWMNVLPAIVYSKTVGLLLNALVEDLTFRVTAVEDIPAATAVHLVTVFNIVVNRGPNVLEEPKEVHQYVKRWTKFQELILILGAKLRDIDDRWADGKGPLALEFTPDEVKQLIRALFQNTERRSAILLKIK